MPHPKGYLREEKGFYYYHDGSVGYYDKYGRWQWFWEKHVQLQQTQKFDQQQQLLRAQIADRFALTSVWGNLQETAREALADTPSNYAAKHSIPLATQQLALHAAFRDVLTRAPSDYHTFQTTSAAYLESLVAEATAKKNDGLVDWAHEVTRMIASGDASKALSEARGPTRALDDAARRRGDSVDPTTTPAGLQQAASALINASHRYHEKQDKLTDGAQQEAAKAALQRRLDAAHIEPAGWEYLRALGGPELEAAVWAASKELPAEAESIARTVRALAARRQTDTAALKELEDARVAITASIRARVPATKPTPVATASPSSPTTTTITVATSPQLERLTSTEARIRILRDSRAQVRNAIAIDRPECQHALRTAFWDAVECPTVYPAKEGSAAAAFKIWRTGRGGLLDDQVMRFMNESEDAPALSVGADDKPPLVDSLPSQSVEQVREELRDARAVLLPRIKIASSSAQAFEAIRAQLTPLLKAVERPELCRDEALSKFLDEMDAVVRHVRIYNPEHKAECERWYDDFHAAFVGRHAPTAPTSVQKTATTAPSLDQSPASRAVVEVQLRSVADNLKFLLRPETITLDTVRSELAPLLRQVQRPLFVHNNDLLAFVRVFYPLLPIVPVKLQPAVMDLYHGFLDAYNGAIAV